VIHLDQQLLGFRWYCDRARRRHPDLVMPAGVYQPGGFTIKQLMDAKPQPPFGRAGPTGNLDESWKNGYLLATTGLTHPLVPADRYPNFEQWAERDRQAMANYDSPDAAALSHRLVGADAGRVAAEPASRARSLGARLQSRCGQRGGTCALGSESARAGRAASRWLAHAWHPAEPGVPSIEIHASILKNLGIGYEILSRTDRAFTPRIAQAWEIFVAKAPVTDPDLPAARAYLKRSRPATRH